MLFIYFVFFFRFFHDRFFFVLFMIVFILDFLVSVGNSFIYIFSGVDVLFLFTFYSSVVVYFFTFSPALTFVFVSEKIVKYQHFINYAQFIFIKSLERNKKIKSVFHFSLSLSLVPWIRICCPTWKVSDFLFINCALFPLFFVQNAEKK